MAGITSARPFGERKQRLVLYVGLLFGILAAILVVAIASGGGGGGGGGASQSVVVANQVIPANTRITHEMLDVKILGADEVSPEAFTARSQVVNRVVAGEVAADTQIVPSLVSDKVGDGLAFTVSPGMRAISIDAREVVTTGGNLTPGDQVDVVGVFEVSSLIGVQSIIAQFAPGQPANIPLAEITGDLADAIILALLSGDEEAEGFGSGNITFNITLTVAQDMKVLALSQTAVDELEGGAAIGTTTGEPQQAETEPRAVTVTIEVTPEQAQILALANQKGAMRLALRGFGDAETVPLSPVITLIDRELN